MSFSAVAAPPRLVRMESECRREQIAVVALLRSRPQGLVLAQVAGRILECGSAVGLWEELTGDALLADPAQVNALEEAEAEVDGWAAAGISLSTILDAEYPQRLRAVHEAPALLFSRGRLLGKDRAVSVVGSRKASAEGLRRASAIAQFLVGEGLTVLSGLAEGIDTAAHTAALENGGRTVAVIGTGIQRHFPAQNRELQEAIAERGLLLSQFWPDVPGARHTFPLRNATMSGYGMATVVVEAGEKSGARIQARVAVEHGRQVVLTDLVVQQNQWARDLIGRPGVHQVGSLDEVAQTIRRIVEDYDKARAAVRSLLSF
ncbi:DNA-processing protein DprA [Kineosporia babensis]|uniref:DNA-protecting protein DprA n=1 Tax=Kineosporia babensis TaxID=499548 RepID=A0A9X1SW19_9ACTN|nr:DNA-processing protein DprA [Kineosporia babensis]MCD5313480.1 DNA-protecting protein DprA [Kineosporia babensis]